ncbi:16S rRNA (adenine(1518)-N(6)/adenine(1519)-N(6))-dimethyltransferase RsmA [Candidatus Pelagibacter sp.]|uniref:16S rRNA (adenine(1518)-N(6)/adenine(1519)-N(6))- dimethyltransferase RsmA n=1 Tax=Candidatus Pelagibacter sp. TaxID=2024849 RepID=UPI003F83D614
MIKAKKSLGQNFLTDKNILEKIVNIVPIKGKTVLEVGPGSGNLTSFILNKNPKKFIVIEKDNDLVRYLDEIFNNQITIINEDILNIDEKILSKDKLTVFGNLPYNISTEILSKWIVNLKNNFWFDHLILMFQKEVAERIIAKHNTSQYGRLSVLANWKLDIKKIYDVKPQSFSPKPKIDSTILYFSPKKNYHELKNSKNLEKVTRVFFLHRRKMLKKPFNQIFNGNQNVLNKLKIDLNLRPQNLNYEMYYQLTSEYEKLIC